MILFTTSLDAVAKEHGSNTLHYVPTHQHNDYHPYRITCWFHTLTYNRIKPDESFSTILLILSCSNNTTCKICRNKQGQFANNRNMTHRFTFISAWACKWSFFVLFCQSARRTSFLCLLKLLLVWIYETFIRAFCSRNIVSFIITSVDSSAGASGNTASNRRILKMKQVLDGEDLLDCFKKSLFCDVALNADDGQR